MKKLLYVTEKGNVVNSLAAALAEGENYTTFIENIEPGEPKMTEKQKASRIKIK